MKKGFTLIELLVSVTIIIVVTVFVLVNYPGINRVFSLQKDRSVKWLKISGKVKKEQFP